MTCVKYQKRKGTSGIRGQLYETKLISLILYRAKHDDSIEQFTLASNVDEIGAFDDICFKAKVKGFNKPVTVFIQAKHKDDSTQTVNIDMAKYFHSYLKIRERFYLICKDELVQGTFEETEYFFVIYTSGKDNFDNILIENEFVSKLNDLIDTGGTVKQPYKHVDDVQLQCKMIINNQIISLAKRIATYVSDDSGNYQMMLSDELVLRYHVILAQKVFNISEIIPDGPNMYCRTASFRQDFFIEDIKEEYLILFKDTLYDEVLKKQNIRSDKKEQFKLLPLKEFKVPIAFGNKDLTIRGNDARIERRLNYLTTKITDLVGNCKTTNIVNVDESLDKGLLQLNGGLASAIGNIFVCDDNTELMKITESLEFLGDLAKRLYKKLKTKIHNLHEYKFRFEVNIFPKLSWDCGKHETNLAKDFLSKLLYYSHQADETGVEEILKSDIEDHVLKHHQHVDYFKPKIDAIFLKYHDEVQKWWMLPHEASCLTKDSDLFKNSIKSVFNYPLLNLIKVTYMIKTKPIDYKFSQDAVASLELQEQHFSSVIIAENIVLTVVKVMQYLKNKNHVLLDLEYIVNLPANYRYDLCIELTNTNEEFVIFVCDKIQNSVNEKKTLANIAKSLQGKKTIIIANSVTAEIVKKYFPHVDNTVYDNQNRLIDMSEESQRSILETTTVIFQNKEVKLDLVVDDQSKAYVIGDVLNKIFSEKANVISKLIVDRNYEVIKHLYVDRRIYAVHRCYGIRYLSVEEPRVVVKTFFDVDDKVVILVAKPGMGKSTLLTHLSLKTKEIDPTVWIVRVNLLEYSKEFNKWNKDNTDIDSLEILNFMCQVVLREQLGKDNKVEIVLEEENGAVYLKHCTGDEWTAFELKLFIHYYNERKIIFLFDGFDEICPHYTNVVVKYLKILSNDAHEHKIWITCRLTFEVHLQDIAEGWGLMPFIWEVKEFLHKYWKSNLIIEEFNSHQLQNIFDFIKYMIESEHSSVRPFEYLLHDVIYVNVFSYIITEIECSHTLSLFRHLAVKETQLNSNALMPIEGLNYYKEKYADMLKEAKALSVQYNIVNRHDVNEDDDNDAGIPLHLYLAAGYFVNKLKDNNTKHINWNLDIDAFTFLESFLETKLKKIRFQEKNNMDTNYPDILIIYDDSLTTITNNYKKIAAYSFFRDLHYFLIFNKQQVKEIQYMISQIKTIGDKTGIITRVDEEDLAVFVHRSVGEYFAVEYLCDLLKKERRKAKQKLLVKFMFQVFVFDYLVNIRTIMDAKLQTDEKLLRIVQSHSDIVFDLILIQDEIVSDCLVPTGYKMGDGISRFLSALSFYPHHSLIHALGEDLPNFGSLIQSIIERHLHNDNLNDFIRIVNNDYILTLVILNKRHELIFFALNIVRKIDKSKLKLICNRDNESNVLGFTNFEDLNNSECLMCLHRRYVKFWGQLYLPRSS